MADPVVHPPTRAEQEQAAAELRQIEAEIFARWGEGRMDPTKERIEALLDVLGSPQRAYRTIHITGTNGKTSTARMIEELLRTFGLRTGRYTSPHLSRVNERIVIDGEQISDVALVAAYRDIEPYLGIVDERFDIKLSFFEVMTALAYAVFADAPVDVAVIEVGLGGTWDATNVIDAEIAVVTPISLDHTKILGNDVATIAKEKAGIIKPDATAILAAQPNEAAAELIRHSVEVGAAVAREGLEFGVLERQMAVDGQLISLQGLGGEYRDIYLPLHGSHQAQNAALALAAVEVFFGAGAKTGGIDADLVREAFAAVTSPGRLEMVRNAPAILLDAAHNVGGMTVTVEAVKEEYDFRRLIGVVAVLADKDAVGLLELLEPVLDEIVVTQNSSSRALDADDLAVDAVAVFGADRVTVEPRLDDAIERAVQLAEENEDGILAGAGVLVTGSVVTAGEARTLLVRESANEQGRAHSNGKSVGESNA